MAIKKCPECGEKSFIKTPFGSKMRESLGILIHVANVHYWCCLKCEHKTEKVSINTKAGDYFDLPWYKRIFKTF